MWVIADWGSGLATAGALGCAIASWRIADQEQQAVAAANREDARDRAAHASSSDGSAHALPLGCPTVSSEDGSTVYVLNNSSHPFLNVTVFATRVGCWRLD